MCLPATRTRPGRTPEQATAPHANLSQQQPPSSTPTAQACANAPKACPMYPHLVNVTHSHPKLRHSHPVGPRCHQTNGLVSTWTGRRHPKHGDVFLGRREEGSGPQHRPILMLLAH